MSVPSTVPEFLAVLHKSGVADPQRLKAFLAGPHENPLPTAPTAFADLLTREGLVTRFQARHLLKGKWRLILSGKYTILEPLGSGGMGNVYLCAHKIMKRFVAIKVLSTEQSVDPAGLERFHREARAVAQLRHPNIAVAFDVDQDPPFHFLVMEFIDGTSLQQLVKSSGPMDPIRAAHYIHQAALGLQHAHEAGLVHRDVKPANLIVDREGTLKVLDLGLARFFHDHSDELTKKHDAGTVLGTADYLAPEQVIDSHHAFPRADIYSLGLTFYFLLAGQSAMQEGSVAQKLLWHQMREPKPLAELRGDIPKKLIAVVGKMTAKNPDDRYQTMAEVAEALSPWTQTPIPPPSEEELPHSAILRHFTPGDGGSSSRSKPSGPGSKLPAPARSSASQTQTKIAVRPTVVAADTAGGEQATFITKRTDESDSAPTRRSPKQARSTPAQSPNRRRLFVAGGVLASILLVVGLIAALRPSATKPVTDPSPPTAPKNPDSPPAIAKAIETETVDKPPMRREEPISVKSGLDAWQVRTPQYEATVDKADGCLSSLRIAGVEFLKTGGALAGGKSFARGAYFYSEKDGHQGLVKLPDVKQESPRVLTATGGKFSVRYEFRVDAVHLTAQNATDETVPFYVIFDSARVHEVSNAQGEQLSVPVAMKQSDALDAKWKTTTWFADRARLKVTDRTDNATTRIWGPWTDDNSQVWEADAATYNRCDVVLEASVAPEVEKPTLKPGGVLIARDGAARRIQTELYEATIDPDGCMPSLRIDGVEVLRANLDVSRGAYFLQGRALQLFDVRRPTPNTLIAQSSAASIRYEFAPDKMTWNVENKSDKAMPFFMVFDTTVTAVRNGNDEWTKSPFAKGANDPIDPKWSTTTWFAGRSKFKLTGGTKVWGLWLDKYQVWEAFLMPKEKRDITVEIGLTDAAEAAKVAEVAGRKPVAPTELALYAPLDHQVFQRRTKQLGSMKLRGRVRADYDRLEFRILGKSVGGPADEQWREIPLKEKSRIFEAAVDIPAGGWYKVDVRAVKAGKTVGEMSVDHVGMGEVFVGAGQSNSTNCGQERTKQTSGMVSSFSGTEWQSADDPQPGVHDNSSGGSYWPAFGDEMFAKYRVPIGVASTGHSGTSVNQWTPGGELFRWMTGRMNQLGREGFRAVLWHQGESDVSMSAEEYARKMTALIQESRRAVGWDVPWFVAEVSYHNPSQTSFPTTRAGQKKLWEQGIAFEGPDTDTLTGDNRDEGGKGIHFSPKGLKAHGKLWAEKVAAYLDGKP